jgi:hypothetical protein
MVYAKCEIVSKDGERERVREREIKIKIKNI